MSLENYNKFCWQDGDLQTKPGNYKHFAWRLGNLILSHPKNIIVRADEFTADLSYLKDWHKKVLQNPKHNSIRNKKADIDLSKAQKNHISDYTKDSGYINTALREDGNLKPHIKMMASLDKVTNSPLKYDTVVYRGISDKEAARLKVGTIAKEKAYLSTSLDPDTAHQSMTSNNFVRAFLKKGDKGSYLPHTRGYNANKDSEEELLLPRDQEYKVLGKHVDEGVNYIDVQVHKPKDKPLVKSNLQNKIDYLGLK